MVAVVAFSLAMETEPMPQAQRRTDFDDDDDDLDERGILRDGRSTRVAMVFADGTTVTRTQFLDAIRARDPLAGHRPGFADASSPLIDSDAQDAALDAWAERGRINREAWRNATVAPFERPRPSTQRGQDERNAPSRYPSRADPPRSHPARPGSDFHDGEQGDAERAWEERNERDANAWRG